MWAQWGHLGNVSQAWVVCPWCQGTGLYARWREHPEARRQLADQRLTKFGVVFP
jgi:hypothetical protein